MKNIESILELITLLILAIIIVLPEICYSLVLRGRDKIVDMWGEL